MLARPGVVFRKLSGVMPYLSLGVAYDAGGRVAGDEGIPGDRAAGWGAGALGGGWFAADGGWFADAVRRGDACRGRPRSGGPAPSRWTGDIAHLVRRALEGGVLVDGVRATAAFGIRSSALNGPSSTGIPPPDLRCALITGAGTNRVLALRRGCVSSRKMLLCSAPRGRPARPRGTYAMSSCHGRVRARILQREWIRWHAWPALGFIQGTVCLGVLR